VVPHQHAGGVLRALMRAGDLHHTAPPPDTVTLLLGLPLGPHTPTLLSPAHRLHVPTAPTGRQHLQLHRARRPSSRSTRFPNPSIFPCGRAQLSRRMETPAKFWGRTCRTTRVTLRSPLPRSWRLHHLLPQAIPCSPLPAMYRLPDAQTWRTTALPVLATGAASIPASRFKAWGVLCSNALWAASPVTACTASQTWCTCSRQLRMHRHGAAR